MSELGASNRRISQGPRWPDVRGWVAVGMFALTTFLLMLMRDPGMRGDEFFQTIATVIISNGLMAVVGWAYSSSPKQTEAQPVKIEQPANDPVPTTDIPTTTVTAAEQEEQAPWDRQSANS